MPLPIIQRIEDMPRRPNGNLDWRVLLPFRGQALPPDKIAKELGITESRLRARILKQGIIGALSKKAISAEQAGRLGSAHWRRRFLPARRSP